MSFNFEKILFYATAITGVITLIDMLYWAKKREKQRANPADTDDMPVIIDYARSFFPILLIVFLLRSFLVEPFRIPSGSLEPTLLTGDFILVNKYDYGLRLPISHQKLLGNGKPARGDILIFRWPPDTSFNFIKRVIGLPGDHIQYINKELTINGQKIEQTIPDEMKGEVDTSDGRTVQKKLENLMGIKHAIYVDMSKTGDDYPNIVVPNNMYFVMGDNRDDSEDSRYWGFVPDENIVGKAILVWMSWDNTELGIRWHRIGTLVH